MLPEHALLDEPDVEEGTDIFLAYLESLGLTRSEARATLRALVYGERSGILTHGLGRITGGFIAQALTKGLMEPGIEPRLIGTRGDLQRWDARNGIGYYALETILMRVLSRQGHQDRLLLQIENLYPTNVLAQPVELLCDAGFVCFMTSRSPQRVLGPIGRRDVDQARPTIGTNAQAWGYRRDDGPHMVFDASFAAATNGDTAVALASAVGGLDLDAYLTHDGQRPASADDLLANGRFSGHIRSAGGADDHRGFGALLPAEILHWFGHAASPGSTFVMALRPHDESAFRRARDEFERSYRSSLAFRDGEPLRLPNETSAYRRVRTPAQDVLTAAASTVPAVDPDLAELLRLQVVDPPTVRTATGRAVPWVSPAAALLDCLEENGNVPVREDVVGNDEPSSGGRSDRPGTAVWCAPVDTPVHWRSEDRETARITSALAAMRARPTAAWVVGAPLALGLARSRNHGDPTPTVVVCAGPSDRAELDGVCPDGTLFARETHLREAPDEAEVDEYDLLVTLDGADQRTLESRPAGASDTGLAGLPRTVRAGLGSARARRRWRINELVQRVAADLDLGLLRDELTALAEGDTQQDFFQQWATEGYSLPALSQHSQLIQACLEELAVEPHHRVLDLGCGDAGLARRLGPVAQLDLVDASAAMLERVRPEAIRASSVNLIHGDFATAPPGPYDRLVSIMALHHVPHDSIKQVLRTCVARLAPGGLLFLGESFLDTADLDDDRTIDRISEVYTRKIFNAARQGATSHALKDVQIAGRVLNGLGEHMRTRLQWTRLLEETGLEIVRSRDTAPELMYGYLVGKRPVA